jgi:hypothetical protein
MSKPLMKTLMILAVLTLLFGEWLTPQPASAVALTAGITATVDSNAKSGIPGSVVSYKLTVKNSSGAPVTLTFSASTVGGWDVPTFSQSSLPLPDATPVVVEVYAPIPSTATTGQNNVASIVINDGISDAYTIPLTTTAKAPSVSGRPLVVVNSYTSSPNPIKPYQEFTLSVVFENRGQTTANNLIVTFAGTDLYPRSNGGVSSTSSLGSSGDKVTFTQTFLAGGNLSWQEAAPLTATAVYSDSNGQSYNEVFSLTLGITAPAYYAATATPQPQNKPQLVITGINTDVDPIQPGSIFNLKLSITNLGKVDAKAVTMVLGGGVTPGDQTGTQQASGVSGSSGDLTNFAPLGSSNLVAIGDVKQGETLNTTQQLVTNVSTQPGAYTLKISFVYDNDKGIRMVDDQVITLLVFSLPQVEISFYRAPGDFTVGMPGTLPIQVTNLGKKTNVLGNMKVTVENASLTNDVSLVGALDPGGYYTLDSELIPMMEGPLDVLVTINYTDDFNQPRFITNTLSVNVMPAPEFTDGLEGQNGSGLPTDVPVVEVPETFWSKVLRFFKGLFGLGSGEKQNLPDGSETVPTEQFYPAKPGKG